MWVSNVNRFVWRMCFYLLQKLTGCFVGSVFKLKTSLGENDEFIHHWKETNLSLTTKMYLRVLDIRIPTNRNECFDFEHFEPKSRQYGSKNHMFFTLPFRSISSRLFGWHNCIQRLYVLNYLDSSKKIITKTNNESELNDLLMLCAQCGPHKQNLRKVSRISRAEQKSLLLLLAVCCRVKTNLGLKSKLELKWGEKKVSDWNDITSAQLFDLSIKI